MTSALCGCLNVQIHIKGDSLAQLPSPSNDLDLVESQDEFFQQSPKQVELTSSGVVILHDFLIQKRNAGRWNVYHCICCKMDTHGMPHVTYLPVLANPALMTNPQQILTLQQSEKFSPVFKILLPTFGNTGPSSPRIFPEKGVQMDTTVAAIQQLMSNFLKKEEEQVGERIQRYTEQQQAALLDLEARVRQDRNTLLILLAQKQETPVEKKLQSLSLAKEATPPPSPTMRATFGFQSPTREQSSARRRTVDIADDDILFEFDSEYLDHNVSTSDPFDPNEFDYEDSSRDEGISIPRPNQAPRSNHDSALAKSLPMRVPTLSNYRTQDIDIEDDKTPQNPAEMAASIKALARSVHGDSDSFWDLPRPRLNTLH